MQICSELDNDALVGNAGWGGQDILCSIVWLLVNRFKKFNSTYL